MFTNLFKQKNSHHHQAQALYQGALNNTREAVFYDGCGVPDTFDGRFDLLLVHIFIQLNRQMSAPGYDAVSQDLFDLTFLNMEETLREMGIGDMGIPKHMRRMMTAFNGRMHAYQSGLEGGKDALEKALRRNLFGTQDDTPGEAIAKMRDFILDNVKDKTQTGYENPVIKEAA